MAKVTYEGPTKKGDPTTVFQTRDDTQLPVGVEKDLDDEIAAELAAGVEGHKFTVDGEASARNVSKADLRARVDELGLEVPASANKDELAAAIAEAEEAGA